MLEQRGNSSLEFRGFAQIYLQLSSMLQKKVLQDNFEFFIISLHVYIAYALQEFLLLDIHYSLHMLMLIFQTLVQKLALLKYRRKLSFSV